MEVAKAGKPKRPEEQLLRSSARTTFTFILTFVRNILNNSKKMGSKDVRFLLFMCICATSFTVNGLERVGTTWGINGRNRGLELATDIPKQVILIRVCGDLVRDTGALKERRKCTQRCALFVGCRCSWDFGVLFRIRLPVFVYTVPCWCSINSGHVYVNLRIMWNGILLSLR